MSAGEGERTHVVVMGVAGSGKTTVAEGIAQLTGWSFAEGDAYHPRANVEKMAAGTPLDDADRWPWLHRLVAWTAEQDAAGRSSVLACSALRRSYRDLLRTGADHVRFVHVHGDRALLEERMQVRAGHFFPARLLDSQLETLEPLGPDEDGLVVGLDLEPAEQVDLAVRWLREGQDTCA